jgi:hypothetical protein
VRAEREREEARGVAGCGSPFIGWRGKGRRRCEAVGKRFRRWGAIKVRGASVGRPFGEGKGRGGAG